MKTSSLSASIFAAAICAGASAATVDLQYTGMGANEIVNLISPGYNGQAYTGAIMVTATNSNAIGIPNGNYLIYCADLYQDSSPAVNTYSVVSILTIPTSAPMTALAAGLLSNMYAFAGGAQYGANAALNCGFQLAVWDIVTDAIAGLGLNVGAFQANGESAAADAFYNAFIAAALGGQQGSPLVGLSNGEYQDYIWDGDHIVPSPGAFALMGLSGLVSSRRRRA
ncbi:MAG: hypothetical protein K8R92_01885 [Planctomycetes bacterium]|nr:hypothetical protein [Planctomycetota bacterium]